MLVSVGIVWERLNNKVSLDIDVFISVVVFDDYLKIDKLWMIFGKGEDLWWILI